jgi:hypothetical protein
VFQEKRVVEDDHGDVVTQTAEKKINFKSIFKMISDTSSSLSVAMKQGIERSTNELKVLAAKMLCWRLVLKLMRDLCHMNTEFQK